MCDTLMGDGCVVCGPGLPYAEHRVDETTFRTGETFVYREFSRCGPLQIAQVPPNLGDYYSTSEYYSFTESPRMAQGWLRSRPMRAALRVNSGLSYRVPLLRPARLGRGLAR